MKGFTLIEVVVAVAVTLTITGFILVNYNSYNDTQTLKQSALTLKNNLRFAQAKASAGEKPISVACTQLLGYSLSFLANAYTLQASCNPEGSVGPVISVDLPAGITFSPVPGPLTYTVLAQGTSLASASCITLVGFDKNYKISVQTNGDINDFGLLYSGSCP